MTAPALVRTAGRGARRPAARRGIDRWAGMVEGYFRLHAALTYAFLFLPKKVRNHYRKYPARNTYLRPEQQ